MIFGFGDFSNANMPLSKITDVGYGKDIVPRGWKYGLINASHYKTSCTFRRNQFGQFRDMLEQRQYSRFYTGDDMRLDFIAPIFVRFKSRGGLTSVSPIATNSQNLSIFATSSLPYFDGVSRDRGGYTQPDLLGDWTISL